MADTTSLSVKGKDPGPDIYYRSDVRDVLEVHVPYLLRDSKTSSVAIEPSVAVKNENNFFDLLNDLSYPMYLHWIILRMNGYYSPVEYMSDKLEILVPSKDTINRILNMHQTIHVIR